MITDILHTTISYCDNERRIFNQVKTAVEAGFSCKIAALAHPELPQSEERYGGILERIKIKRHSGGMLKFLSFNLKLFFYLLRQDFRLLHAHDLWVLPSSALAAAVKRRPLIYDAHEYYRGLKIFNRKKLSGKIWRLAERIFIRRVSALIAINTFHEELYHRDFPAIGKSEVIMNLPEAGKTAPPGWAEREIPVLFQGIFKPGRGLVPLVMALVRLKKVSASFIGFGEIEDELRQLVRESAAPVRFLGKKSVDELLGFSEKARIGVVLFEPDSLNYLYASPNKFFEYVIAGTPVIASDLPTFRDFLRQYEVGLLVNPSDPAQIGDAILRLLDDRGFWESCHQNCLKARLEWNWEAQAPRLINLYRELM
ncbi:MAG: glycosyltransferase [Calditrichia bacterium]